MKIVYTFTILHVLDQVSDNKSALQTSLDLGQTVQPFPLDSLGSHVLSLISFNFQEGDTITVFGQSTRKMKYFPCLVNSLSCRTCTN